MSTATVEKDAVRFPVFRDRQGNRFIFPGFYSFKEKSVSWGYCRQIEVALGVTEEKTTFAVVPDSDGMLTFPRVVADAISGGFAHGGDHVWIIGGPEFDAICSEPKP